MIKKVSNFFDWLFEDVFRVGGLDLDDYVNAIERRFDVKIEKSDFEQFETLGNVHQVILNKLQHRNHTPDAVWETLITITVEAFAVEKVNLQSDTRLVEDLGA